MLAALEAQQHFISPNGAMGFQFAGEFGEVDGTMVLVNLDGVSAAEGDLGAANSAEMGKLTLLADGTAGSRVRGIDFGDFVAPHVTGEKRASHPVMGANDPFDRLDRFQ